MDISFIDISFKKLLDFKLMLGLPVEHYHPLLFQHFYCFFEFTI